MSPKDPNHLISTTSSPQNPVPAIQERHSSATAVPLRRSTRQRRQPERLTVQWNTKTYCNDIRRPGIIKPDVLGGGV